MRLNKLTWFALGLLASFGITVFAAYTISQGGTNATSQTSNGITFYNGTSITSSSNLTWDGTKFSVSSSTPFGIVSINAPAGTPAFAVGSSTATSLIVATNGWTGIGDTSPNHGGYGALQGLTIKGDGSNAAILEFFRPVSSGASIVGRFGAGDTSNSTLGFIDFRSDSSGSTGAIDFLTSTGSNPASRMRILNDGRIGIGTTTSQWLLELSSSTQAQLALSNAGTKFGTFRVEDDGRLAYATSSDTTFATSSVAVFTIDSNGFPVFTSLSGVGCAQFDANGKVTNTGTACGSGGSGITALGSGYASTTNTVVTFSTSTLSFNGLTVGQTIVPSAGALTFTPTITGTLNVAGGGTNAASFAPSSIITSNSAGTALIATTSQLTTGSFLATSTTATSQIGGALFSGAAAIAGLGTTNSQLQISQNVNNLARQLDLANTNMGANALSSLTFENGNSTNNGASSAYIGGLVFCGPNFATAGYSGCPPNGLAMYNTDGGVAIGAISANAASSSLTFYAGNNGGFGGAMPDMILKVTGGSKAGGNPYLGLGTTSPQWLATLYASNTPQLALGANPTDNIWTFNSVGNNLYVATSSPTTYATSSQSAFRIDANGFPYFSAFASGQLLYSGASGEVLNVATSTATCSAGITCNTFTVVGSTNPSFTNSGVTSIVAGTNISISGATGAVTVNSNGPVSTSTNETSGQLAYWTTTSGAIAKLGKVATTSETCTSPVTCTAHDVLTGGGAISLATVPIASGGTNATSFAGNSIITSNSGGTALIATTSQLTTGSIIATSTVSNSFFLNNLVGFGTSTMAWPVVIASSTQPQLVMSAGAGVAQWALRAETDGTFDISTTTVAGTATTSTSAVHMSASGAAGLAVGTSTPYKQISFNGTGAWTGLSASAGTQSGSVCLSSSNEIINDSGVCIVSSLRYKNVRGGLSPAESLSEVVKLKPISFYYKPDFNGGKQTDPNYNGEQVGFGAEDVQKIDTRLVIVDTATSTFEGREYAPGTPRTVRYEQMTALLASAIQELNARTGGARRSAEENWQWIAISGLACFAGFQQRQIKKLKK